MCQAGRTVWKESPLSNKSSFWEHKAAGTLRVRLTLGPAASESRVSCVALKPQVGDRKLAGGQEQRPRTPYLNKGELAARNVITGAQQAPGGEGVGGRCVGGFVLRFFFFLLWLLFSFLSIQFWRIQQPGSLAKPGSDTHTALSSPNGSCQLLQPCTKTPGTPPIAGTGLFICPACLASHFFTCVLPPRWLQLPSGS